MCIQQVDIRTFKSFDSFDSFKRRFLNKLPKKYLLEESKDLCWVWPNIKHQKSYGQLSWDGTVYPVHRLSYIIFKGLIPNDKLVRHTCNNSKCVNPNHLILGSTSDNSIDTVKSGTQGHQKLNSSDVLEIRKSLKINTKYGFASILAKKYNVTLSTIYDIKKGHSWSWLKDTK